MKKEPIEIILRKQFKFLESDYGFSLSSSGGSKELAYYNLIYLNHTTGVDITFELRESYISIMLYKLVNGKLIENPYEITKKTIFHGISLDSVVFCRNPKAVMKAYYNYDYSDKKEGIPLYVAAYANNLKEYASDILSGDFRIFAKAAKIERKVLKGMSIWG